MHVFESLEKHGHKPHFSDKELEALRLAQSDNW